MFRYLLYQETSASRNKCILYLPIFINKKWLPHQLLNFTIKQIGIFKFVLFTTGFLSRIFNCSVDINAVLFPKSLNNKNIMKSSGSSPSFLEEDEEEEEAAENGYDVMPNIPDALLRKLRVHTSLPGRWYPFIIVLVLMPESVWRFCSIKWRWQSIEDLCLLLMSWSHL